MTNVTHAKVKVLIEGEDYPVLRRTMKDLARTLQEFAVALRDSMEDTTPEQDREHRKLCEEYFKSPQGFIPTTSTYTVMLCPQCGKSQANAYIIEADECHCPRIPLP
jgi:hypothetical protein